MIEQSLIIIGMAVVTFGIRYFLLAFAGKARMPAQLQHGLQYVPAAVLTAIIVPSVLMPAGEIDFNVTNVYLIAALVAFLVARFTNNLLLTIVAGLLTYVGVNFLI